MRVRFGIALFVGWAAVAFAQPSPNLLKDPSFEEALYEPFSEYWHPFNKAFNETITPRTRHFAAKIYGQFNGTTNYSGVYQDVPAEAGRTYIASAWFRQNSGDVLEGGNSAWVKLEFLRADWSLIETFQSAQRVHARSPKNKYVFVSTGPAEAPPGTAWARFVAIFEQMPDNARGAIIVDDAMLREIP